MTDEERVPMHKIRARCPDCKGTDVVAYVYSNGIGWDCCNDGCELIGTTDEDWRDETAPLADVLDYVNPPAEGTRPVHLWAGKIRLPPELTE